MDSDPNRRATEPARRAAKVFLRWICLIVLLLQGLTPNCFSFAAEPLPPTHVDDFTGRPRVVIMSDIGNEPDDQMSFVRLLLYSNEFEIEGIVATTSTWQKSAVHPETMERSP